jgi:hypothetical protein
MIKADDLRRGDIEQASGETSTMMMKESKNLLKNVIICICGLLQIALVESEILLAEDGPFAGFVLETSKSKCHNTDQSNGHSIPVLFHVKFRNGTIRKSDNHFHPPLDIWSGWKEYRRVRNHLT